MDENTKFQLTKPKLLCKPILTFYFAFASLLQINERKRGVL